MDNDRTIRNTEDTRDDRIMRDEGRTMTRRRTETGEIDSRAIDGDRMRDREIRDEEMRDAVD